MVALDWTTMVNQVVVAGRPADVEDAALGWQELIGNVRDVSTAIERDLKGIEAFWTGKAADAFTEKIKGVSKGLTTVADSAAPEGGAGIVDTLRTAAQDLQKAQAAMPIPATMIGDVMAARDASVFIGPGVLEMELKSGFFNSAPMQVAGWLTDQFRSLLSDVEGDAREAYDAVNTQHEGAADRAPNPGGTSNVTVPKVTTPDLGGGGPGGGGPGGIPDLGGAPQGGGGGMPDLGGGGSGVGKMPGLLDGSPIDKPTSPDLDGYQPGSGLAGAGGGLTTGTPSGLGGGLSGGGLGGVGGGAGLGSGGAGLGGAGGLGRIPGGGSLGKPISPGPAGMGGGLAGRGAGGGKLGSGGMAGMGGIGGGAGGRGSGSARGAGAGMAGIGGAGAGAGKGAGGRGSGLGGARGAGGGMAGMGGGAGAGKGGAAGRGAAGRGAGFAGGTGAGGNAYGDEDEYDSWLYEDDNVWNEGTDVPPPPVLGN
ncbi:WXG100 family type VII secretion target [Asanoa sp. NPDC049573]|uniref:WXG100 family type VII secretion target n=1 Tax=Asanoa sp. NPDC049573 TaxID=3155396 RepID=UPI00342261A9